METPRAPEKLKWGSVVRQRETFGLTVDQQDGGGVDREQDLRRQDRYRQMLGPGLDRCEPPLSCISSRLSSWSERELPREIA